MLGYARLTISKCNLSNFGEIHGSPPGSLVKRVSAFHEDVSTMCANERSQDCRKNSSHETGIREGHRHSKDARAKRCLQKMRQSVHVTVEGNSISG